MINLEHANRLHGTDVYDADGDKIGSVGQVWDDGNGRPAWASVKTGLFGLNESLVPLDSADLRDERLVVPFDKAKVKDAPNIDASHDEPLQGEDVDKLYQYYGLSWEDSSRAYQAGAATAGANYTGSESTYSEGRTAGYASDSSADYSAGRTAGYASDSAEGRADYAEGRASGDDAMTRSEERLNVDTRAEQTGRARLRKYVVTEQEQVTVPVEREEVRLEREPITDANRGDALGGPAITESEHEVTLHAERATVDKEAVPVERVRLGKETVRDEETVGGEVRKERIEADLPDENGKRNFS
ncbi:PRC and DUF2382 domain-containing protein [Actinoplanes sp. Pm04-4]|uniref:PRC and DUF2382 domain-containing protein n=1 Tax=Paractinoplanes pyxinae TaxID=2997416 RepID=A0ABT4AYP1_9ACTN|nr:PRC and DUF2382 domain-containing protein [Actinoplanes pyxinae]MCY1139366.1 PRC and DUF2382 domain-containing protein [Actinoplanes pyxinae]